MIIKLLLIALIIIASFLVGVNLSAKAARGLVILKELKKSFVIMEKDINYSLCSIFECFDNIKNSCTVSEVKQVFVELALGGNQCESLEDTFKLAFSRKELNLGKALSERIIEIGKCIGYMDRQSNSKLIRILIDELDEEIENKRKDIKDRQKVYKTVAISCGLYISLILI